MLSEDMALRILRMDHLVFVSRHIEGKNHHFQVHCIAQFTTLQTFELYPLLLRSLSTKKDHEVLVFLVCKPV